MTMSSRRRWQLSVLCGLAMWYVVTGSGLWTGLEPATILYRATVAGLTVAICCFAGLALLRN